LTGIYYDPYDYEIDADPYPIWKRMRDEAPLYYNQKYDFYAVTRYADVRDVSVDWHTYSSAYGSVLEIIRNPPCSGGSATCCSDPRSPRDLAAH
jgi:cytochrome P450